MEKWDSVTSIDSETWFSLLDSSSMTVIIHHTLVKGSASYCFFLSSLADTIMSGLIQGHSMDTAIKAGLRAAYYLLFSTRAVSPVLSPAMFSHDESNSVLIL